MRLRAVLVDASLGAAGVPPGALEDADVWGAVQLGRAEALRPPITPAR